jgi:hypothetical protein
MISAMAKYKVIDAAFDARDLFAPAVVTPERLQQRAH